MFEKNRFLTQSDQSRWIEGGNIILVPSFSQNGLPYWDGTGSTLPHCTLLLRSVISIVPARAVDELRYPVAQFSILLAVTVGSH